MDRAKNGDAKLHSGTVPGVTSKGLNVYTGYPADDGFKSEKQGADVFPPERRRGDNRAASLPGSER